MVYVVPQYTRLHLDLYLVRQEFPPNSFRSTGAPAVPLQSAPRPFEWQGCGCAPSAASPFRDKCHVCPFGKIAEVAQ